MSFPPVFRVFHFYSTPGSLAACISTSCDFFLVFFELYENSTMGGDSSRICRLKLTLIVVGVMSRKNITLFFRRLVC